MNKKKTIIPTLLFVNLIFVVSLTSCQKKKSDELAPTKPSNTLTAYPTAGHYSWNFKVGTTDQTSHLVIYSTPDSIGYAMEGQVYTNNYMMHKISYSEKNNENRWIGIGKGGESINKDGAYFVMFFKNSKEKEFTVFKKEFETQKEAEEFALPSDSSEESHGWNVYKR